VAGDWIKMRGNLWDDPRVARLCDSTGQSEAAVIGALYWLWAAADQHTETGVMPGLSLRQIDRKTGVQGFGDALASIGWIIDSPEGIEIVNFEEHNGESAKRRCADAKRKSLSRLQSAECPQNAGQNPDESGQVAELEKEKEKEITTTSPSAKADRCPVEGIIEAYRQHAPSLVQPRIVTDATKVQISARWRQDPKHQSIEFWCDFFAYCESTDFLAGRAQGRGGGKPFRADLDWLTKAGNFAKVVNGNYENG
jgi:hypothetical protein